MADSTARLTDGTVRHGDAMIESIDQDILVTYRLTARLNDDVVRAAVEQLSPEERRRHDRFILSRDRRDFAVAHALLRRALSARGDRAPHEWTFTSNAHGKPEVVAGMDSSTRLSFNLAHTDGLVACVIARNAALGIDVEAIDRPTDGLALARRFFSRAEIEDLERCPVSTRQARFTEIWTLKEAYVKAIGRGLSFPLNQFAIVFVGPSSLRFEPKPGVSSAAWQFALFAPSDRHRMAVAVGGPLGQTHRLAIRVESDQVGETSRPLRVSISDQDPNTATSANAPQHESNLL